MRIQSSASGLSRTWESAVRKKTQNSRLKLEIESKHNKNTNTARGAVVVLNSRLLEQLFANFHDLNSARQTVCISCAQQNNTQNQSLPVRLRLDFDLRGLCCEMKTPNKWTGWRYGVLVGGLVGAIGLALYPIAVQPMLDPSQYSMFFTDPLLIWVADFVFDCRKDTSWDQERSQTGGNSARK